VAASRKEDTRPLLTMEVRADYDAVLARQRVRKAAALLGITRQQRVRLATAVAEAVRGALTAAGNAAVLLALEQAPGAGWLRVHVDYPPRAGDSAGADNEQEQRIVRLGRLVSGLRRETTDQGWTRIVLGAPLPAGEPVTDRQLERLGQRLARHHLPQPLQEVQQQNQELLLAMEQLQRSQQELQLKAQEWQATFDAINDGVCLVDAGDRVVQANQALARLVGLPVEQIAGRPWPELSPFCWDPGTPIPLQQARAIRGRASAATRHGKRWYRLQVDPLLDAAGQQVRSVLLVADITAEKRALEKIVNSESKLRTINEALKTYAHTVSHDLKGPLAGAIAASQVLQRLLELPLTEQTTADLRELAGVFSGSVQRSVELINDLLALAEAGRTGSSGVVDVAQTMRRVLEDRDGSLRERGLELDVQPGLGSVVAAEAHIYQLFGNLLDNALRYARGSVRVERLGCPGAGCHRFLVRDDGPGFPEQLLDRVFEEFVSGDEGGSGVGLATVRRIAETYGGRARAYNDGGACVEVEIVDAAPAEPEP
jgi:PAS domain S-box-containing protein